MTARKTAIIQLRVTKQEKRAVEQAADRDHRTITSYVRHLISADLERREEARPC